MYNTPYVRPNLLGRVVGATKSFNFSNFLDGTQKTLGIINQAIPIVYQVKPIFQNARTMFRIADEIRKPSAVSNTNSDSMRSANSSETSNNNIGITNRPIFYI